ncbi:MAG: hypothetical protein Q4B65_02495 [Candidatus Saccharibacteria bacterium]|nr:hypothetical protein [Candidatus Saccharibacteria bacterium]
MNRRRQSGFLPLLKLELKSLFGVNRFLHIKDPKQKTQYRGAAVGFGFLVLAGLGLVGAMTYGLWYLGLIEIVPAYLVLLSSILILVVGIFSAGGRIFGERGYDLLVAMPVKSSAIVWARIFGLYIGDLILAMVIMLPGVVMYGILAQPAIWFYLVAMVGTLFVPIIPLTISVLVGLMVMGLSARTKNKNIIQTVLSVVITMGLIALSTLIQSTMQSLGSEQLFQFVKLIGDSIQKAYLPAMWLSRAMVEFDMLSLLLFVGVSAAVILVVGFIVAKNFYAILWRLTNFSAKHNYEIKTMKQRSLRRALYAREVKRYLASSVYVTNTIMGPIIATIMIIIFSVTGAELVQILLAVGVDVAGLLPLAFTAIFTMMTSASVSISMEGKQIWLTKSLPIPIRKWLDSKILLNLSLLLPFYLVGAVTMIIILQPNLLQLLWVILIPILLALFAVVFGIFINLKSHKFEWSRDEMVVKQSLPAVVGGFAGLLISILVGLAVLFVPAEYGILVKILICLGLIFGTAYFYRKNNKKKFVEL